ncbi:hypothetical protein V8C37DRAFT_396203 [Trichoderma ceciliae]
MFQHSLRSAYQPAAWSQVCMAKNNKKKKTWPRPPETMARMAERGSLLAYWQPNPWSKDPQKCGLGWRQRRCSNNAEQADEAIWSAFAWPYVTWWASVLVFKCSLGMQPHDRMSFRIVISGAINWLAAAAVGFKALDIMCVAERRYGCSVRDTCSQCLFLRTINWTTCTLTSESSDVACFVSFQSLNASNRLKTCNLDPFEPPLPRSAFTAPPSPSAGRLIAERAARPRR